MSFTVGYLIYIVLCIIGLHIGINYLYSVHTTRKVQGKDLLFALACVLLNVLLLAYLVNKDGKIKRKGKSFRYDKDIPLGDSTDELVIAKALEQYFINNILNFI